MTTDDVTTQAQDPAARHFDLDKVMPPITTTTAAARVRSMYRTAREAVAAVVAFANDAAGTTAGLEAQRDAALAAVAESEALVAQLQAELNAIREGGADRGFAIACFGGIVYWLGLEPLDVSTEDAGQRYAIRFSVSSVGRESRVQFVIEALPNGVTLKVIMPDGKGRTYTFKDGVLTAEDYDSLAYYLLRRGGVVLVDTDNRLPDGVQDDMNVGIVDEGPKTRTYREHPDAIVGYGTASSTGDQPAGAALRLPGPPRFGN